MAESSPGAAPANDLRDLRACVALGRGAKATPTARTADGISDWQGAGWRSANLSSPTKSAPRRSSGGRTAAICRPCWRRRSPAAALRRARSKSRTRSTRADAATASCWACSGVSTRTSGSSAGSGGTGRVDTVLRGRIRARAQKLLSRHQCRDACVVRRQKAACAGARARRSGHLLRGAAADGAGHGRLVEDPVPPLAAGAAGERPPDAGISRNYWLLATIGEAALVFDAPPLAQAAYVAARASHEAGFGSVATSRRNAALILAERKDGAELLALLFPKPRIAIFSGHVVDGADRASPRFPLNAVPCVDAAIRAWIESAASIGYAAAASGGDMLFHAALAARRAERHVVLPHSREVFSEHAWRRRGRIG